MPMPLEGIRVLDWTIWQQGPVAAAMLGDLGAEVIKIEERVGGDPGRGMLRAAGLDLSGRPNFYFEANNRNKKSLTVDLKKPAGVEIVQRLAEHADVFVQNFRKGVAARLGLEASTLRARNPRLIYASASGYGPEGEESGTPSFDYLWYRNVQAIPGALPKAEGMIAARRPAMIVAAQAPSSIDPTGQAGRILLAEYRRTDTVAGMPIYDRRAHRVPAREVHGPLPG